MLLDELDEWARKSPRPWGAAGWGGVGVLIRIARGKDAGRLLLRHLGAALEALAHILPSQRLQLVQCVQFVQLVQLFPARAVAE